MASAFWPAPKALQKHIANGSHKGASTSIRIILHLLGNGFFRGHLFPRFLEQKEKQCGFFYAKSNEKFALALLRASSKFNLSLINCQVLFLCRGSQLTLLWLLGGRRGKQLPFQRVLWDITKSCLQNLVPFCQFSGTLNILDLPSFADDISESRSWVSSAGPEHSTVSQALWVHTGARDEQRRCVR